MRQHNVRRLLVLVLVMVPALLLGTFLTAACFPNVYAWRETTGYAIVDLQEGVITIHNHLARPKIIRLPDECAAVWSSHMGRLDEGERYALLSPYIRYIPDHRLSKITAVYPNMHAITAWEKFDSTICDKRVHEYAAYLRKMTGEGRLPWWHAVPERWLFTFDEFGALQIDFIPTRSADELLKIVEAMQRDQDMP
jgi:hypothetical protein